MSTISLISAGVILLLAARSGWSEKNRAESAFQILKSLNGKWSIHSADTLLPFEMVYASGSKDSIVTEQFGKELSVFYQDGQELKMIHFCNARNQPRLTLADPGAPGTLQFDAVEVSNMADKHAAHVQQILYRILSEKKIDLEIVWEENGRSSSEKYSLLKMVEGAQ